MLMGSAMLTGARAVTSALSPVTSPFTLASEKKRMKNQPYGYSA